MKSILLVLMSTVLLGTIQGHSVSTDPEVTIPNGKIRGQSIDYRGSKVYQFLGIPYAEPPLNELRFKKPVPAKSWEGVLSFSDWTPQCMQPNLMSLPSAQQSFSEDCLNVNVFTPETAFNGNDELRPVMVWIHGGGFLTGSANLDAFNGTVLVALEGVVFVSVNYRLGAFGFLSIPEYNISGNYGLWDQQLALQWVKENIKYFGGNPDDVTIFGESAGSMSVSAQILSPQSRGLFKNAILQSGSMYNIQLFYKADAASKLLDATNCTLSKDISSCLESADSSALTVNRLLFWPVVGDEFLPKASEELIKSIDNNLNLFIGVVENEGVAFMRSIVPAVSNLTLEEAKRIVGKAYGESLIDYFTERYLSKVDPNDSEGLTLAIAKSFGDITLACPTYMFGHDAVSYSNAQVFAYFLTQKQTSTLMPFKYSTVPTHADDLPFMFGVPLRQSSSTFDDALLSLKMVEIWANFGRTGSTPELASQEWFKWKSDESGKVKFFVMELNSQRLGQVNNELALYCQSNWPFPVKEIHTRH